MKPLYFGAEARRLFGVYHPAERGAARDVGVLLCSPIGEESIRAHRAFRQLAATLAEIGFHVLRFDYFAIGDSAGASDEGRVSQWVEDIAIAADELKDQSGVRRLAWVGLRFGATLAALAATRRRDLDALVMWDPVISGSAYLQELDEQHIAYLYGSNLRPVPGLRAGSDEVLGWPCPKALRLEIQRIDVIIAGRFSLNTVAFLLSTDGGEDDRKLVEKARALSSRTLTAHVPEAGNWNQEAVVVPAKALRTIVEFLS